MKYKLKKGSKFKLFCNLFVIGGIIYVIYHVANYYGSISPKDSSEISYFIFVTVLFLMIVMKCSYWLQEGLKGIVELFEKKTSEKGNKTK